MKRTVLVVIALFGAFLTAAASPDRDLILAVAKGRFKTVQELVEKKKANVNCTYDKGKTPLHWAVISGDLKMVAYLIAKGARVDARDEYGDTPLHKAALRQTDDLDIIKYLVLKGADINALNRYGWTPLHSFSYYDNSLVVKYLIMQEALLTNLTARKFMEITNGMTAYDIAVRKHYTNVMLALENPDRYRQLSKTPYLMLSISNDFGPENTLTGPSKGNLVLRVENRGGAYASGVNTVVEIPTNLAGLLVGTAPSFSLDIGASHELVIPVEVTREVKDGLAEIRITMRETSFNKEAGPVIYRFRTRSPRPPVLSITSLFPTNQRAVLNGMDKLALSWQIEDRLTNSGYADNVVLRLLPVSNCAQMTFSELSNITLVPGEKKELRLEIAGDENLKDGLARVRAVASDQNFHVAVTNNVIIEKKHLLRPVLTAGVFYNVTYTPKTLQETVTNWDYETNFVEYTNVTVTNETLQTNLLITTNCRTSNFIAETTNTNRESGIVLKNTGEGPARNITLSIQTVLAGSIETKSQVFLFNVPLIDTNCMVTLPFTNFILTMPASRNILDIKWSDDRKISVVETNFTVEAR